MTAVEASMPGRLSQRRGRVRMAAVGYVSHGWGVLPGSVWDGHRFTLGHSRTRVGGLVPVMVSGRTLREPREVWSWWSVAPYGILIRAGEDLDVISAPVELVSAAVELGYSALRSCPIILGPTGARLLVGRRTRLSGVLRDHAAVAVLPAGAWVPLPPTRVPGGVLRWLVHPTDLDYTPGDSDAVQDALTHTLAASHNITRRATQPGIGGALWR